MYDIQFYIRLRNDYDKYNFLMTIISKNDVINNVIGDCSCGLTGLL